MGIIYLLTPHYVILNVVKDLYASTNVYTDFSSLRSSK